MYTITSSAGLGTTTVTAEGAVAVLAQHLHDLAADGPIRWEIRTPTGLEFAGHLNLNRRPDNGFIDELLAELNHSLTDRRSARQEGRPA